MNHLGLIYFSEKIFVQYIHLCVVSVVSNASCNFDDIDICGYQDLSETGINWSHIRNQSETISYCIYHV